MGVHHRAWTYTTDSHTLPSSFQSLTLFLSDLAQYFQGQGPPPKFQATLHFWEESPGSSHSQENLITVQVSSASGLICVK
jgi:interferon regulatory factor 9